MDRTKNINRVRERINRPYDIVIIGGGASGVGCAVDAASRGLDVLLLEQSDFGKGTSSRSTKLVHGGVRYLEQGNISLVREALTERGILRKNAPQLVKKQAFIVPCYSLWEKIFYGTGLKIYNLLSGRYGFGKSKILSAEKTLEKLPNIKKENLTGGVTYYDGQFDDTRLLIELVKTADKNKACLINYARVFGITKNTDGRNDGVQFECAESGELFYVKTRVIINATGAFTDKVRKMSVTESKEMMTLSQGIHLVFDKSFLPDETALMIPKTTDGRVLFAIPWHGKTVVGTTDTAIENAELEPKPLEEEIDFILKTCQNYLVKSPTRSDILSVFVGIRPLVRSSGTKNTAKLSRDHTIEIDSSGLLTLTGGKWTTYRNMAEDAINKAIELAGLPAKKCVTKHIKIEDEHPAKISGIIAENPVLAGKIDPDFPYQKAEIVYAVRDEMARTVEDILARRTRILFLDARVAMQVAPEVAEIMAKELGEDEKWKDDRIREFEKVARNYLLTN
jgi:glycerol-3-phosphate dehydrogenase